MGFPETYEIDSGNGFYKQIGNAVGPGLLVLCTEGFYKLYKTYRYPEAALSPKVVPEMISQLARGVLQTMKR